MAALGKTIKGLAKYRGDWAKLLDAATPDLSHADSLPGRLTEVTGFGSNPGNLRMLAYVPDGLPASPPLVVVLHGCTQTAAGYDHGAGWSILADRYGFALLFPEQQRANNPNLCFNWFESDDIQRDRGEPQSIRQMIERMARDHGVDRSRVFVTGLSAGGAMTSVMLATYPDVFAGGAIIAGLPYGSATSVQEAFESMYQGRGRSAREWGDLVRAASPHRGPWPTVSVWHGSADATVKSLNAAEVVKQWADVHGVSAEPAEESKVGGYPRQVWRDGAGREVIESFTITSMAHGTPLATGDAENAYGAAGPFLLDVGISSTYHIAKFWGLTESEFRAPAADMAVADMAVADMAVADMARVVAPNGAGAGAQPQFKAIDRPAAVERFEPAPRRQQARTASLPIDIGAVIDKALKAAGLKH